jgi:hypothetical protein
MKVLAVHGIGHQEDTAAAWQPRWEEAIVTSLRAANPGAAPSVEFLPYDDLFEAPVARLTYMDFARALWYLASGVVRRGRGPFDLTDSTRWYAGMVVAWVNDEGLRERLRGRLADTVNAAKPDLVIAHSLGSLIAYDTFATDGGLISGRSLLTLGSQLGNLFVRDSVFAGRLAPLQDAADWVHLYNPNDHVFTAPLDFGEFQTAVNFDEVETLFGSPFSGFSDNHRAVNPDDPDEAYLTHPQARELAWPRLAGTRAVRALAVPSRAVKEVAARAAPDRRALLVGVNAYAGKAPPLEGCVNDVFLMSSALQECGFEAEDIRVVLDDRATADGIRERLHWLLDGVNGGDVRFFSYSGHGAQLPVYGPEGRIDRVESCLAAHDFDWTPGRAITDRDLVDFYSQLPYDAHLLMVLDCCYSGGLTRGGTRPRGLDPPDDIRHRLLRWDAGVQMWKPRELPKLNPDVKKWNRAEQYAGPSGATLRLGRAMSLRGLPDKEYDKRRKQLGHKGPYLPVVYEACGEAELSYEYQHGVIGHGAFTYALVAALRRLGSAGEAVTFADLLKETGRVLKELGYDQHPEVVGPKAVLKAPVPWKGPGHASAGEA